MDWNALLTTFALLFVAELGDKTQLAVIAQTCKFRRPWAVFAGASLALILVTALGALGGQVIGQIVPASVMRVVAGLAFVLMGIWIGHQAAGTRGAQTTACAADEAADCTPTGAWDWHAFGATLGLLLVAELGDKTQLAVLSLSSQSAAPGAVFVGGALALTLITALGVIGGQSLSRLVPQRLLLWISAIAFVIMGITIGVSK